MTGIIRDEGAGKWIVRWPGREPESFDELIKAYTALVRLLYERDKSEREARK